MLFSSTLLLLVPFIFAAPIQQWPMTNNNNNNQQDVLQNDSRLPSASTMNLVMHDDIQAYYENIVDEIISTRSEDILVKLASSMNNQQSREAILQPQAIALINRPAQDACLARIPGMIAQQLHSLHAKVLDTIEPTLDTLLQTYPIMISDSNDDQQDIDLMQQHLVQLNTAMDQHVMQILTQTRLEHKVALQLAVCENQLTSSSQTPPRRSLWLLLKNIWLNDAQSAKSSEKEQQQSDRSCGDNMKEHDASSSSSSLFTSGPSLLGSYMDTVADNLHLEFEGRLMDLYTTLRSDVFDEEIIA